MNRLLTRIVTLAAFVTILLAIPLARYTDAQTESALIFGQVTDQSSAALPGVMVTATSPSLQVASVTEVTNERGEYRLAGLPIGTYEVVYSLQGFETIRREDIRLTVDFAARVDVVLKVGSVQEAITVSGAAPVIDPASSGARTQLTTEALESAPNGRNGMIALLAQTPGVRSNFDVGGSTLNDVPTFRANGFNGKAWQTLEGVLTSAPRDVQGGNYWDYTVIEEARVQSVANDAEVATRGVLLNAIVKSGGNDFHGSAFAADTNHNLQSNNIDSTLAAQGITSGDTLQTRWDVNGDLGGRIVRDKLWFYVSLHARRNLVNTLNTFNPDGTPATTDSNQKIHTEKVSYQISKQNRVVGFYQWEQKLRLGAASVNIPVESSTDERQKHYITKIEWESVHGSNLITSLQYGRWEWVADYYDRSGGKVSTMDLVTLKQTGATTTAGNNASEWQNDIKGALTWYRPDLFAGNHELKAGFEYWDPVINRAWVPRAAGEYQLIYRNGVPFEVNTYNSPVDPRTAARHTHVFMKDTWTLARRVTLNVGARFAHDEGFVPAQCRPAGPFAQSGCISDITFPTWNTLSPRLYASYDVAGDGKTVIKGGWGRFYHIREIEELLPANPYIATSSTYLWHDLNGNKAFDPGETNLDPNGPDFIQSTVKDDGVVWGTVPDPNELQPKVDQLSVSVERELMPNVALRVTGVYSVATNVERRLNLVRPPSVYNIPITNPDPGPDGKVGTADDPGTSLTYYDFPAALAGVKNQQFILTNDPTANQHPKTIEVAASRRLSHGWQFAASYSATKNDNPLLNANTFGAPPDFNPNVNINVYDRSWEWLGRLSGSYELPAKFQVSGNYENRSGTVFARQVLLSGGVAIPSIVVNAEPYGSRRYPNINELDARVERTFTVAHGQRLTARVNVFNVLNHGTVTTQIIQSGATFLKPTAITLPRIFEFSALYRF